MAALPPCAQCYAGGVQHEGDPIYQDQILASYPVYIAEAYGNTIHENVGILYLSDMSGIWHNSRLLADQFAACGYLTIVANYNGKVRAEGKEIEDTVQTHSGSSAEATRAIRDALDYLRERGCTKIGTVGFCRGASWALDLLAGDQVMAAFIAHPAGSTEVQVDAITKPLSIAAADGDVAFTDEKRKISERLLKNNGLPYQINLYSHVQHGFAASRPVKTRAEVYAKRQAFVQAVSWMEEHVVRGDQDPSEPWGEVTHVM